MKQRKIFTELQKHLSSKRHTILVGPRQTGKTTLLKQLRDYCNEQGWPTVYLDLEHKDIRDELDKMPGNIFLYAPLTQERVYPHRQGETLFQEPGKGTGENANDLFPGLRHEKCTAQQLPALHTQSRQR